MKRYYSQLLKEHLASFRQMFFLTGPRQVGKTTCVKELESFSRQTLYLNWDFVSHRQIILDIDLLKAELKLDTLREEGPIVIFDEIHKDKEWKQFLKGFFDVYEKKLSVVVTGSARLNHYKRGGDSLMGRYFIHRMHPFSVGELLNPTLAEKEIRPPSLIPDDQWQNLWEFGGFPEPFKAADKGFYKRWSHLRHQQIFKEDLRGLSRTLDVDRLELLAELLRYQVGSLTSYQNLAEKTGVTIPTVKRWISMLKSVFYCFSLQPWSNNIPRSLLKEPKYYLWDWSLVEGAGTRAENFIASHLLKAVHMWTDRGMGEYQLHYLRDKQKQEVDFLVVKDKKPWMLVEVKKGENKGITKALRDFQKKTEAPYAFQVVFDGDYVHQDCFKHNEPIIVPARTFLSQLV